MKISYMKKREDFYHILRETLYAIGVKIRCADSEEQEWEHWYVYEELNAIVPERISSSVKDFLLTEYRVNHIIKRLLIRLYISLLFCTRGLLANKTLYVSPELNLRVDLIYPCNRKIRLFDFKNHIVLVISKSGFPLTFITNEIKYRNSHPCSYIKPILDFGESWYKEEIIVGKPLARVSQKNELEMYHNLVIKILEERIHCTKRTVLLQEYLEVVITDIFKVANEIYKPKKMSADFLNPVISKLKKLIVEYGQVTIDLCDSHGDLQAGNIWIENITKKILFIDWEMAEERSVYYDRCVFERELRTEKGWTSFVPYSLDKKVNIVIIEDILIRIKELKALPENYGIDNFRQYIKHISECMGV